jgi:hypothetical protein
MTFEQYDKEVRSGLKMRADGCVGGGLFQKAAIDMLSDLDVPNAPPHVMIAFNKNYSVITGILSIIFHSEEWNEDDGIRLQEQLIKRYRKD